MPCLFHLDPHADARGGPAPFPEHGAEPRHAPSVPFRVLRARVHLAIDPIQRRWQGETRFEVAALASFGGAYRFDLDGPTLTSVEDGDGQPLRWRAVDRGVAIEAPPSATLVLRYEGRHARAGLYFVGPTEDDPARVPMAWTQCQDEDAHLFMPVVDHPRVRHPWTIELEGPLGCTLLSNGRLEERGEREGRAYARFVQDAPMPAYLFTAVVAPLETVVDDGAPIPVAFHVPPGEGAAARRGLGRTTAMVRWLSGLLGFPYPWPRYDQVVVWDFTFGGMENVACTTLTDLVLVDERAGDHWPVDALVVHELAHQWFGDLVTCADWSQAWLNEGFATFCEQLWWEHAKPTDEAVWYAWSQLQDYLEEDATRYRRPIATALFREPVDVFDRHLYEKSALVLRTLRTQLGEGPFWEGVRAYVRGQAHRSVHTRDLQRALEEATGASLEGFFAQWIHGAGHPALSVRVAEDDGGGVLVSVTQTQSGADTPVAFQVPLVVELVDEDGVAHRRTLAVRERASTFVLAAPSGRRVRAARVDPDLAALADLQVDAPMAMLLALVADPSPVVAARALHALAGRGEAGAWDGVLAALRAHPFWGVRAEAAAILARRGGAVARGALIDALRAEREPRARAAIATGLGGFPDGVAADALLVAVGAPTQTWHEQGALLLALGRTRDPRAVPVLHSFLGTATWGEIVRQKALHGLGASEDPRAAEVLLAHARPGRSERLAVGAAQGLAALAEALPPLRRRIREALESLARDGGVRGRVAAVQALARLRDPASAPVLELVHASDPDGRARRQAWEALVTVRQGRGEPDAIAGLRARVAALSSENDTLRARLDRLESPRVEGEKTKPS